MGVKEVKEFLKSNNIDVNFNTILITGTNGKSSTSHLVNLFLMKFSKLLNLDLKVGLFSKPHILKINERIKINYSDINDSDFNNLITKVNELKSNVNLNWFDELVLVAIFYFLENKIDLGIFEIGIGGKYDSTNALDSIINIITNIGLEHTEILGNSIKSIAYQKSGIIKNNSFTLTFANKGFKTIYNQSIKKNSFILNLNKIFRINLVSINIQTDKLDQFKIKFSYLVKFIPDKKLIKKMNNKVFKNFEFSKEVFENLYEILKLFFKDGVIIDFYSPYLIKNYLIAFVCSILYLILDKRYKEIINNKHFFKKILTNLSIDFEFLGRFNILRIKNSFLLLDSAKDILALEYILKLFFYKLYKTICDNFKRKIKISLVFSFSKGKVFQKFQNIYKIIYKNIDKIESIYFLEHLVEQKAQDSSIPFNSFYVNLKEISNSDFNVLSKLKNLGKLNEKKLFELINLNEFIFITGSVYFVANVFELLNKNFIEIK